MSDALPIVFGATVTGPRHLRDGAENQDAWGHRRVGPWRVVVVADGLGSRARSAEGARAACRAVPKALSIWRGYRPDPPVLVRLIHLLWNAEVAPLAAKDAATTCLFAALAPDGSGWAGQLGDGLVLIDAADAPRALTERSDRDFTNETQGLGISTRLDDWTVEELSTCPKRLMLCTDGVADDLLPERRAALLEWLDTEVGSRPPNLRWRDVRALLRDWPTPGHTDDKTLAVVRTAQ